MTYNSVSTKSDIRYMRTALALARRGLGNVWPNPSVGCVLVREDLGNRLVGRGWTQSGGRPHAETEAIRRAGGLARGATAYITLEPCCHLGKTKACTDALSDAGITRVVTAMVDPDPRVKGKGIIQLRNRGIEVEVGALKNEAELLNIGFNYRINLGRPWITLKVATTSDGYIASRSGNSRWITGLDARRYGHMLRARHDAIITGIGTIEADDPMLTCRLQGLENQSPIRVIMDTNSRLSAKSAIALSALEVPVWRFRRLDYEPRATDFKFEDIPCPVGEDGFLAISHLLSNLASRGITRLLVEAGPSLTTAFLKSGYVDQIHWFRSESMMGGDGRAVANSLNVDNLTELYKFDRIETRAINKDNLEIYRQRCSA